MHIQFRFKNLLAKKEKEALHKKLFAVILAAGVLCIVYLVCVFAGFSANQKTVDYTDLAAKHTITTKAKEPAPAPPKVVDTPQILDIATACPFVNVDALKPQEQAAPLPPVPLPTVPNDSQSAFPLPPMQVPTDQNGGMQRIQDAAVRGLLIGNIAGNNMAILSNGSLVKEGDPYMESRIAVIDQGGISLESGREISYGTNP